jgi:putative flippase GtrA
MSKIKKYFNKSWGRWVVIGVTTFSIDFILFLSLYKTTNSVVISNFFSASLATLLNYILNYNWSFHSEKIKVKSSIKYFLNLIFWWVISTTIISILIKYKVNPEVAKVAPMIFIVPVNYFILKLFVFKNNK